MRGEYNPGNSTYIFSKVIWKGENAIRKTVDYYDIIMHYPEDEAGRKELARRVALVHAQTVVENLAALSCPADEKIRVIDEIIKRRSKTK